MLKVTLLVVFLSYVLCQSTTNTLLSISEPKENQLLIPGQQLIVQYSINGININGTASVMPNYPSSLDMYFKWWSQKNNQSIQFKAASGLQTDSIPGGNSKIYSHSWKLPNCHFFRRYMPSEWSFSLVFDPQYPEIKVMPANGMQSQAHIALVPLGPKQSQITIPVSVSFNATAMDDTQHKGC